MAIQVHALDGALLTNRSSIEKLFKIQKEDGEKKVFVISPVRNGELAFTHLIRSAEKKDERLWASLEKVRNAYMELAENVVKRSSEFSADEIDSAFLKAEEVLRVIWLLGKASLEAEDYLDSLTSYFICLILKNRALQLSLTSSLIDSSSALEKEEWPDEVSFVYGKMPSPLAYSDASGKVRDEGESEYEASLIASKVQADLVFWNSKSLLRTASIKDVPSAHVIESLSYEEATELSFFGAPIIHPHSFLPAQLKGLDIYLRYFSDIENKGTLISRRKSGKGKNARAFSVVRNIVLVNIEGGGLSGIPGISARLFSSLKREKISVIFISQASSEYSICFAIRKADGRKAERTINREFMYEIESGAINNISITDDVAILAVVGDNMSGSVGTAGLFFSSLARSGVNVQAIAQGSSERNISAVISEKDSKKALRSLHSTFFLSEQTLSIGLYGPGNIGGTLLDQLARESVRLKETFDLDLRVRAIARRGYMMLSDEGIDLRSWREDFDKQKIKYNEQIFLEHVGASYYPHKVIVDCTSSNDLALKYYSLMEKGFHIVTPNKKAASAPYEYYKSLFDISRKTGSKFYYETTVGAGLPIIVTLKDLRETGDDVKKVEGIFSGTLAWLFSSYDGSLPFSQLIKKAYEMGYTEPDPRDDLSGMDVARKTCIVARELGYKTEISEIPVRNLVPEDLREVSLEEFFSRLEEMDEEISSLYETARKDGKKLRYTGCVEDGKCRVDLAFYDEKHPFSQASGTDNVIQFTTERYKVQPLVIKGPGAGPQVTAAGVFADILRLGEYLGSRV